jgi:hypothetical protein
VPVPWCFGVEPGLWAYCISEDGVLRRYSPASWEFEPLAGLGLGTGTVTIAPGSEPDLSVEVGGPAALVFSAQLAHAAALVGLGERALDDTVDYVKQREQFGGPIGRFQAVKHALAEVAVQLEVAWDAVLYASMRPDAESVAIAHLQAGTAVDRAARAMVQYFGGIAMTWEHHAHLYVKTAQAGRWRFGSSSDHAMRIAGGLVRERITS